jgi:hypothetical protein
MSLLAMVFASYLAHAAAHHLHARWTLASACNVDGGLLGPVSSSASEAPQTEGCIEGMGVGIAPVIAVNLDAAEAEGASSADVEAQLPVVAQGSQLPTPFVLR